MHRCHAAASFFRVLLPKMWRDGGSISAIELPLARRAVLHMVAGERIDNQRDTARMKRFFSNKWIGGDAMSKNAVQVEITFAQGNAPQRAVVESEPPQGRRAYRGGAVSTVRRHCGSHVRQ